MNLYRLKKRLLSKMASLVYKTLNLKLPPIPTTSAIIMNKGRVLAIRLNERNHYALPGGVLERGEDFEQAVRREIAEEAGLKTIKLNYLGSYAFNVDYPTINIAYVAQAEGNPQPSVEGEPEWLEPDKVVSKLVFEDNKAAMREFLKKNYKKI